MNTNSRPTTRKHLQPHPASFAFVLFLGGCSIDASNGAPDADIAVQGGSTAIGTAKTGGSAQSGGSDSAAQGGASAATGGNQATATTTSTGGAAQVATGGAAQVATGGAAQSATGGAAQSATGGAAQSATGGAAQSATGGAAQSATGGAAQVATGGAAQSATGGAAEVATGGAAQSATGGVAQVATGGTTQAATGGATLASTGGAAQAGTGGTAAVTESLCSDDSGAAVPYDYSIGIMGEYAYELSMSCDIGGYLMPLIMADPDQLSQVNAFVADATDWYRADILNCQDATTQLDQNSFGLLPISQSSGLSGDDVDASLTLFSMVLDRHDGQPDGVSADTKDKIKNRINSVKARAVQSQAVGLTKTLTEPDCVPAG